MTATDGKRLLLVRHAMPEVEPGTPAALWHLSTEGRDAARLLGPLVSRPAYFMASTEPKVVETLVEIAAGRTVQTEAAFGEVRRPRVAGDDEYRAQARAYLRGDRPEGWEPQELVVGRFEAAAVEHSGRAAAYGRTLVIGSGGLASSLWLASRYAVEPSPEQFWANLRLPDLIEVDLATRTVRSLRP